MTPGTVQLSLSFRLCSIRLCSTNVHKLSELWCYVQGVYRHKEEEPLMHVKTVDNKMKQRDNRFTDWNLLGLGIYTVYLLFLSNERPTLETLDYTIRIGSTPTFLYFDLYLYSAYAAHYVYICCSWIWGSSTVREKWCLV